MAVPSCVYAAQSTGSGYVTLIGSPTVTLAGGETITVMVNGFSTADVGPPTDSAGSFTKETTAYNAFVDSAKTHGGWYRQFNASAGAHTFAGPTIAGGSDGIVCVIVTKGAPVTPTVRTAAKNQQLTGSNSFALTTGAAAQVGDIAFGCRFHENSVGSTDRITQPTGWTSVFQYLDGAVNLPTDCSFFVVTSAAAVSGTWNDIDPAITDTTGGILVLQMGPSITVPPATQTVPETQTATFNITAIGTGTLHYQWKFNGGNVGSDQNSYARTGCVLADNGGTVTCTVTDDNGTSVSDTAFLFVTAGANQYYIKS